MVTVDIINANKNDIKKSVIELVNVYNYTNITPNLNLLSFKKPVMENALILKDDVTTRSVLIDKINISDILPETIDLKPFMEIDNNSFQLPSMYTEELGNELINDFNNKYQDYFLTTDVELINFKNDYPTEVIRLFILVCKITGFYELDLTDISYIKQDDHYQITVVDTHPIYEGSLKVKI